MVPPFFSSICFLESVFYRGRSEEISKSNIKVYSDFRGGVLGNFSSIYRNPMLVSGGAFAGNLCCRLKFCDFGAGLGKSSGNGGTKCQTLHIKELCHAGSVVWRFLLLLLEGWQSGCNRLHRRTFHYEGGDLYRWLSKSGKEVRVVHSLQELGPRILFWITDRFFITESVLFTWGVMVILIIASVLLTRNLKTRPGKVQAFLEGGIEMLYGLVEGAVGTRNLNLAPYFIGFLIFTFCCNALGLLGLRSATADVNTTFAMGIIAFFMIHGLAIRARTLKGHIHHMSSPYKFMFPINLISEIALPVSLSFRLFGNILGGCIVMAICYMATDALSGMAGLSIPLFGLLLPIPLNLFFDLFEPALQAFIFCMLTMTFVGINTEVDD